MNRRITIVWLLMLGACCGRTSRADALREVVDRETAAAWQTQKLTPSPPAEDAEFLRRVYLDLVGAIPDYRETIAFLDDKDPAKREQLVDRLLADPRYAQHQADVWDMTLFGRNPPGYDTDKREAFQAWLRKQFAENIGYDQWAKAILKAEGNTVDNGPPMYFVQYRNQPEDAVESISQIFLGVQLQCARCHDHPYEPWKQVDFYGMAAFVSRLEVVTVGKAGQLTKYAIGEKANGDILFTGPAKDQKPGMKGEPVGPKFLLASKVPEPPLPKDFKEKKFEQNKVPPAPPFSRKDVLADWVTDAKNPYFARAIVNRIWAQYLGRGIVYPVDNMSPSNEPKLPKLLDELTARFVASKYDLKNLVREIVNSKTYQRSSRGGSGAEFPEWFETARTRPLSAEELVESWRTANGFDAAGSVPGGSVPGGKKADTSRFRPLESGYVLRFFGKPHNGTGDFQGGLHEHLYLNNGPIGNVIGTGKGSLLEALTGGDAAEAKVERLYLSVLNRRPTETERKKIVSFAGAAGGDKRAAEDRWRDAIWALMTSSEFRFNH